MGRGGLRTLGFQGTDMRSGEFGAQTGNYSLLHRNHLRSSVPTSTPSVTLRSCVRDCSLSCNGVPTEHLVHLLHSIVQHCLFSLSCVVNLCVNNLALIDLSKRGSDTDEGRAGRY